jgi:hypothetical protein
VHDQTGGENGVDGAAGDGEVSGVGEDQAL